MSKTVLFQAIEFSKRMQFSSIWPINRTLSGTNTPGQSRPRSDGYERGTLHSPKAPALLKPHQQIVLCHIPDTRVCGEGGLTPSAEVQSVYSTTLADWAKDYAKVVLQNIIKIEFIIVTQNSCSNYCSVCFLYDWLTCLNSLHFVNILKLISPLHKGGVLVV